MAIHDPVEKLKFSISFLSFSTTSSRIGIRGPNFWGATRFESAHDAHGYLLFVHLYDILYWRQQRSVALCGCWMRKIQVLFPVGTIWITRIGPRNYIALVAIAQEITLFMTS